MDLKKIINKLILPKKDKEELVKAIDSSENNSKGSATLFLVDYNKILDFETQVLMDKDFIIIDSEEKAQSVLHVSLDKVINIDIASANFLEKSGQSNIFASEGIIVYVEIEEGSIPHPIYENVKYLFGYSDINDDGKQVAFLFDKNHKFVRCIVTKTRPY